MTDYAEDTTPFKPTRVESAGNIKSKAKNGALQARIDYTCRRVANQCEVVM